MVGAALLSFVHFQPPLPLTRLALASKRRAAQAPRPDRRSRRRPAAAAADALAASASATVALTASASARAPRTFASASATAALAPSTDAAAALAPSVAAPAPRASRGAAASVRADVCRLRGRGVGPGAFVLRGGRVSPGRGAVLHVVGRVRRVGVRGRHAVPERCRRVERDLLRGVARVRAAGPAPVHGDGGGRVLRRGLFVVRRVSGVDV